MSLKCSILGHSFDETAVERDRQEDGSEVVITITELETCTRCGETRVVSENKEVTTMETPASADVADDDTPTAEGAGAGDRGGAAPDLESADGDAEVIGSGDDPAADGVDTAGTDAGGADARVADATDADAGGADAEGGDAEILGGDGDDPEADAQARARTDSTPIPDAESDDPVAGADAENGTDDGVIIDGDTGDDRGPGEWPDDGDDAAAGDPQTEGGADGERSRVTEAVEGDDAAVWTGDDDADESDDSADADWPEEDEQPTESVMGEWPEETTRESADAADEGPTLEQSASPTITVPEGMFKCSECGFTTEVESSSLRAGDFCPECRTGTLVQHEDTE